MLGLYFVVIGQLPIWQSVARPLATAPTPRHRWSRATLIGILVVALGLRLHHLGAIFTTYDLESQHFLFTLLARFIEAERRQGDAVVTVGLATYPYRAFYHAGWEDAESVEALNAIRARVQRTWVIYTIPLQLQGNYPELMRVIERDFTLVKKFRGTLNGGTVYVCRANGASAAAGASSSPSEKGLRHPS